MGTHPASLIDRVDTIRNPIEGLASVLAVRDLRFRIQQAVSTRDLNSHWEERLLALDPLTVLRCLRMAHTPVYELPEDLLTIPDLTKFLGRTMVRRALNTPACDIAGTEPVRRLWLHSVATAHAARSLAEAGGELDPERAYVLGLLHDLPLWLHYLSLRRTGAGATLGAEAWIRQWHLPRCLNEVVTQTMLGYGHEPPLVDRTKPTSIIAAAELLAELADFWHPDDGDVLSRNLLLSVVTKEDLVAAHNLRQSVTQSLGEFGLQTSALEPEQIEAVPSTGNLLPIRNHGNIADLVLSLLSCNDSAYYRSIVTATTSACLRYLGFERAYSVLWCPELRQCHVRAKADLTSRPLRPTVVEPTPREIEIVLHAHASGEAQHIVADSHGAKGLLWLLGADEILVAPLNRAFKSPTFIVMDRALSGSPIRLSQDRAGAKALAGTASLLIENLLLKKRRHRAQKYSLTDPLTRLFNRSVGISRLAHEIARAKRSNLPLTVMMLDLDDFKRLNDTHGHLAGDQALRATAEVLQKTLRRTDMLCRYGGEEFLVVLPETSIEEASISATRVFTAVEETGAAMRLPLTISVGLSTIRTQDDDVEALLSRADIALYASKTRGRNRFSVDEE